MLADKLQSTKLWDTCGKNCAVAWEMGKFGIALWERACYDALRKNPSVVMHLKSLLIGLMAGLVAMPVVAEPENAGVVQPALVDIMGMSRDARCGQVLVTALINGVPMRMMLDTGATHTVLHEESVAKLGEVQWVDTSKMQFRGNANQRPRLLVAPMQVGPGEAPMHPMMVLNLGAVRSMLAEPVDGIIGMDFLKFLPFTFDFRKNEFYWGSPADAALVPVPCVAEPSGRVHWQLSCAGREISLLLDTGSTVTRVRTADWAPGAAGEITAQIGDVNAAERQQLVEGKPGDLTVAPGVALKGVTPLLCSSEELTMLGMDALRHSVLVHLPAADTPGGIFLLAR